MKNKRPSRTNAITTAQTKYKKAISEGIIDP
jgi:hypothetical protein